MSKSKRDANRCKIYAKLGYIQEKLSMMCIYAKTEESKQNNVPHLVVPMGDTRCNVVYFIKSNTYQVFTNTKGSSKQLVRTYAGGDTWAVIRRLRKIARGEAGNSGDEMVDILRAIFPKAQFDKHCQDLYVKYTEEIWKWLHAHYQAAGIITTFKESVMCDDGKYHSVGPIWIEIPFATAECIVNV